MRPTLERLVFDERRDRLCKNKDLITSRTCILTDAYTEFKKTLRASDWAFLPKVSSLMDREHFRSIMYADEERVISVDDFNEPLQALPSQFHDNKLQIENAMRSVLADEGYNSSSDAELATSVLRSPFRGPIRPYTDTLRYTLLCGWGWSNARPSISKQDIALVTKLVELVGLDVRTATAWDMDKQAAEYVCSYCSTSRHIKIYSWRGLVSTVLFRWGLTLNYCCKAFAFQCYFPLLSS